MVRNISDDITKNEILELSREFKKRRLQLEISQLKFSKIANLSQSIINKLENGKIDPTYSTIIKIENSLRDLEKISNQKASEIMIKDIISVDSNEVLSTAIEIMLENDFSQLLVFENDVAIGTIYERTIISLISQKIDIYTSYVKNYLEVLPISVPHNFSVLDLEVIFKHRRNKCVLVRGCITKEGTYEDKIVGIITPSDIFK